MPLTTYSDFVRNTANVPIIVAHRGAWKYAAENSVEAIHLASAAGVKVVEVDVQKSADGQFFIFHDEVLDRMTEESGPVLGRSLAELQAIKLRLGRGRRTDGTFTPLTASPIATLGEILEAARGRVFLDIDVKHPDRDLEAVAAEIHHHDAQGLVDVKLDVCSPEDVRRLAGIRDHCGLLTMPKIQVTAESWRYILDLALQTAAPMAETKFDTMETLLQLTAAAAKENFAIWLNTLDVSPCAAPYIDSRALTDPEGVWGALFAAGAGLIQTDETKALAAFIEGGRKAVAS